MGLHRAVLTRAVALLLAGGVLAPGVAPRSAWAANRHVDIVNKTGMDLRHFYASSTGEDEWEEDILGRDVIADGETFDIDIDDGSGTCRYDFKAVFDDGTSLIRRNIDVCKVETFTYSR